MFFEWDDNKEKLNVAKHGIDFSTAALVFKDLDRIEIYDELHSQTEDRYATIGLINSIAWVVMVVYTPRNETIRIITARKATKTEEEAYFNHEEIY